MIKRTRSEGRLRRLVALVILIPLGMTWTLRAQSPEAAPSPEASATLVVYNESDPDSAALAWFYAAQRHIPKDQIVGLNCATEEQITRAQYDETIAEPLRHLFDQRGWWKLGEGGTGKKQVESNHIRFVALMRGMPLKIAPAAGYEGDKPEPASPIGAHNEAAVDSELAVLGYRLRAISGALNNPYYLSLTNILDLPRQDIMLVCRLDGPSVAVVRRMITDGLATERAGGLRGLAYIDARGLTSKDAGLLEGDQWMQTAAQEARKIGMPVILDNGPSMFPDTYPMRHAALYLGWYSEHVAGPFSKPDFHFVPGAVAVHIHSFSASTVRDAKRNWVGPLLEAGAAATLGNVYEPYLALTPHLDLFTERLGLGMTFAESAYASERVLSWMTTFVGDPLYRPFPAKPVAAGPSTGEAAQWDEFKHAAIRWRKDPKGSTIALQAAGRKMSSGILWEGLGLLQLGADQRVPALESFDQARKTYTEPQDILRATIHEAIQLRGAGKVDDAVKLVQGRVREFPGEPAIAVLKLVVPEAFVK